MWPAILVAAFVANATTTGSIATSLAIGVGNTIEALLGAYLINRLSDGKATFESPAGVARFALLSFLPTALCATIGVSSLAAGGLVERAAMGSVWLTWWLGDLAGALLVTPVIVLWAAADLRRVSWPKLFESIVIFCVACIIGLIAFSPIFGSTERRAAARVPRRAAAAVVRAPPRPARHRDCRRWCWQASRSGARSRAAGRSAAIRSTNPS